MPDTTENYDDREFMYHLEEVRLLRTELSQTHENSYRIISHSFIANFGLFSLYVSAGYNEFSIPDTFLFVPGFLLVLSIWFYLLREADISRIAAYLRIIEKKYSASELGWERFYTSSKIYSNWWRRTTGIAVGSFVLQIAACIYILVSRTV